MFKKYIKIILLLSVSYAGSVSAADKDAATEVLKNKNTTTGFLQEITEDRVHDGPNRTGAEVYEYRCKGCHARNTQGAPMPDDGFEWSMRLRKTGLETMLKHSMEGFSNYLMPPKGGCRDCNQEEVYEAVFYMMETSGIEVAELRKKSKQFK